MRGSQFGQTSTVAPTASAVNLLGQLSLILGAVQFAANAEAIPLPEVHRLPSNH